MVYAETADIRCISATTFSEVTDGLARNWRTPSKPAKVSGDVPTRERALAKLLAPHNLPLLSEVELRKRRPS